MRPRSLNKRALDPVLVFPQSGAKDQRSPRDPEAQPTARLYAGCNASRNPGYDETFPVSSRRSRRPIWRMTVFQASELSRWAAKLACDAVVA